MYQIKLTDMKKVRKEAFLILRIEESFKNKLVAKAAALGETVSEFVRKVLMSKM